MLINFTFSNYASYRDETEFSMVASKARNDKESLLGVPQRPHLKLLPLAAMFGANASGKSTFVRALSELKHLVCSGTISSVPYALDKNSAARPTVFDISMMIDGEIWTYHIETVLFEVLRERLSCTRARSERLIFERDNEKHEFILESSLFVGEGEKLFAHQLGLTLPASKVLLHTIAEIQPAGLAEAVMKVFYWFTHTLCVIKADGQRVFLSKYLFEHSDEYARALHAVDTGIVDFQRIPVDINTLGVPQQVIEKFQKSSHDNMALSHDYSLQLRKENGEIKAYRWKTIHTAEDDETISFNLEQESDGTLRLMHLLPILLDREAIQRVYVIDELDRSLHTQLSRFIIEQHLELARRGVPRQLIFTTHDVQLMDQALIRKDEMWVAQRDENGASQLIAFSDYIDVRKDKDVRKSYLEGRMEGVPVLSPLIIANE